jgi:hypothetical protein
VNIGEESEAVEVPIPVHPDDVPVEPVPEAPQPDREAAPEPAKVPA